MIEVLIIPMPVLVIWGLASLLLDTLIHLLMIQVVGREWADRLFNVLATRMMAWIGAGMLWRALT